LMALQPMERLEATLQPTVLHYARWRCGLRRFARGDCSRQRCAPWRCSGRRRAQCHCGRGGAWHNGTVRSALLRLMVLQPATLCSGALQSTVLRSMALQPAAQIALPLSRDRPPPLSWCRSSLMVLSWCCCTALPSLLQAALFAPCLQLLRRRGFMRVWHIALRAVAVLPRHRAPPVDRRILCLVCSSHFCPPALCRGF